MTLLPFPSAPPARDLAATTQGEWEDLHRHRATVGVLVALAKLQDKLLALLPEDVRTDALCDPEDTFDYLQSAIDESPQRFQHVSGHVTRHDERCRTAAVEIQDLTSKIQEI